MKRSRFTEEQIVKVLKLQENGLKVTDICRQSGICEQTFYRWKFKYGGMEVSEVRRLKELEAENRRLKQLIDEKELDILALKAALEKSINAFTQEAGREGDEGYRRQCAPRFFFDRLESFYVSLPGTEKSG